MYLNRPLDFLSFAVQKKSENPKKCCSYLFLLFPNFILLPESLLTMVGRNKVWCCVIFVQCEDPIAAAAELILIIYFDFIWC